MRTQPGRGGPQPGRGRRGFRANPGHASAFRLQSGSRAPKTRLGWGRGAAESRGKVGGAHEHAEVGGCDRGGNLVLLSRERPPSSSGAAVGRFAAGFAKICNRKICSRKDCRRGKCSGKSRCKSAAAQMPPRFLQLQSLGFAVAKSEAELLWGTRPGGKRLQLGEKRVREQSSSWWQGAGIPPAAGSFP